MSKSKHNNTELKSTDQIIAAGQALEDEGKLDEAERHYRKALALATNPANAYVNLGNLFNLKNDIPSAKKYYQQALEHEPNNSSALANLGRIDLIQNNFTQAVHYFKQAVELFSGQEKAEAAVSYGYALTQLKQNSSAENAFREALKIAPNHPFANLQLGRLLMLKYCPDEATLHLEEALKAIPNESNAHSWLGKVLSDQGFIPEACQHMAMAEKLNPKDAYNAGMHVFTLNYLPGLSSRELFDAQCAYVNRFFKSSYPSSKPLINKKHPEKILKIGYVSSDLRKHPVSRFVEPLLRHHNRQHFEVHCFYNHSNEDQTSQDLKSLADQWHTILDLDDAKAAELIKELGIDLLIDLNGLTHGHRLGVFAQKPAPIQITWLGYLGTTGLKTMDYRICDYQTDPVGKNEPFHTETLIRMPNSQWCHAPYNDLPPISELPLLKNRSITFGSFNNAAKLNDQVLRLWAQLIHKLPESRIHFAAIPEGRAQNRILTIFENLGVEGPRMEFIPRQQYSSYLRTIGNVDIALDPFPYNGGTTSFDTLIMGVPFIAIAGERSISRGGVSILNNLGLSQWIVENQTEFINKTCELVNSPQILQELRSSLRKRLSRSSLMDNVKFTNDIERLYRDCWREWCIR
jgi:predicted O-linked N-acetylglucosamine transferase (SPINDLY family)